MFQVSLIFCLNYFISKVTHERQVLSILPPNNFLYIVLMLLYNVYSLKLYFENNLYARMKKC